MEFRLTIDVAEYGRVDIAEEAAERWLEGFHGTHPEVGPVVDVDAENCTLGVTFSFAAPSIEAALERATEIFRDGARASGLKPTEVVDLALVIGAEGSAGPRYRAQERWQLPDLVHS